MPGTAVQHSDLAFILSLENQHHYILRRSPLTKLGRNELTLYFSLVYTVIENAWRVPPQVAVSVTKYPQQTLRGSE